MKTDPYASPTGFPFKVVEIDGTLSEDVNFDSRSRNCDLGYLRTPFERPQGGIGYRCPGEPIKTFEFKGGTSEHNSRSKCLCNALMADIGLGQIRADGTTELPLVTFGSDLAGANELSKIIQEVGARTRCWSIFEAISHSAMDTTSLILSNQG